MHKVIVFPAIVWLLCVLIVAGFNSYSVFPQAESYRTLRLQKNYDKAGENISFKEEIRKHRENAVSASKVNVQTSMFPIAAFHIHLPRYALTHIAFEISQQFSLDINKVYRLLIVSVFGAFLLIMYACLNELWVPSFLAYIICGTSFTIIFLLMNGRAPFAFLGYAILSWLFITNYWKRNALIATVLAFLALWFSTVSSALFGVCFTFYALSFFTPFGRLISKNNADYVGIRKVNSATLISNILIFVVGMFYIYMLAEKLVMFYGKNLEFIFGILSHGLISLFGEHSIIIFCALAALAISLLVSLRYGLLKYLKETSGSTKIILLIALLPLPFFLVGWIGGMLFFVGAILGISQFLSRELLKRVA